MTTKQATGSYNIAWGDKALYRLTTGSENIALGRGAGDDLTTESRLSPPTSRVVVIRLLGHEIRWHHHGGAIYRTMARLIRALMRVVA